MSNLFHLDLDSLKMKYDQEVLKLKERLLSGVLWEEMDEQRNLIYDLSKAMYDKVQALYSNQTESIRANKV